VQKVGEWEYLHLMDEVYRRRTEGPDYAQCEVVRTWRVSPEREKRTGTIMATFRVRWQGVRAGGDRGPGDPGRRHREVARGRSRLAPPSTPTAHRARRGPLILTGGRPFLLVLRAFPPRVRAKLTGRTRNS
jgi:hypothetical protein